MTPYDGNIKLVCRQRSHWLKATSRALSITPIAVRQWLGLPSSVTAKIEAVTAEPVRVVVMRDSPGRLRSDEKRALRVRQLSGHVREVVLEAGGDAMVVARSVWEPEIYRTDTELNSLGNRPLGQLLFANGRSTWRWREFGYLAPGHPGWSVFTALLMSYADTNDNDLGADSRNKHTLLNKLPRTGCWARRTLYLRHGSRMLVMEAFLPNLLARTPVG